MNENLEHKLRLYSGLIIAFFLLLHLLNAALGIISLDAMDSLGKILFAFWSFPVFLLLLYGSFTVHIALMFVALYRRRSLKMPAWNILQTALGLAMPVLLIGHVVATRGAFEFFEISRNYSNVVAAMWRNPDSVVKQYALIAIAWTHMCVGIHYWLRHKAGYARWLPLLYPLCLLVPLLAGLGFLRSGFEASQSQINLLVNETAIQAASSVTPSARQTLNSIESWLLGLLAFSLAMLLIFRLARRLIDRKRGGFIVHHTLSGKFLKGGPDQSILEILRDSGIQHTSVCGGRGRCTTCRVRINDSKAALESPGELELLALKRIGAGPNVRLACQYKPKHDLTITPVLNQEVLDPLVPQSASVIGHEQKITCMFVDMRDSTKLGEQKLPYDVVFILNQFFMQLDSALRATQGHYATFNGDGLMALYGLDGNQTEGCVKALEGAVEIQKRIEKLNVWLAGELQSPLKVGIGIHCGDAIVGTMGPPSAPTISAIGDNVNITARLEELTKEYACAVVVSEYVLQNAGIHMSDLPRHTVRVRGRAEVLPVYALDNLDFLLQPDSIIE